MAEAAHVLSPIGAQGLNLSLRDVDAAVRAVKNALILGQDIGGDNVLKDYERSRRDDITLRTKGVDGFHRLVANDNPLFSRVRRLGLNTVGLVTPLRGFLMENGLAPSR
jgi:2-octaprenyl-6-methoxyphenol hydroxylase